MLSATKSIQRMIIYLTLIFVESTLAQVILPGKCPSVSVKPDFDVQQYVGRWYEQKRYYAFFETSLKCVSTNYTANDNDTINVLVEGIYPVIGRGPSIEGLAYAKTSEKAKLSVVFPSLPIKVEGSYWILDTDYTSYAVVWSCTPTALSSARFLWILTRERHPSNDILEEAYKTLDKNKISKRLFLKTNQNNCS